MNTHEVFDRYAAQQVAIDHPGYRSDVFPELLRLTPTESEAGGFIEMARLTRDSVDSAIVAQKAYFASIGREFEWKVHDFDTPDNLPERLLAHGFKPDDTEALMVYDVASHTPSRGTPPANIRIERIASIDRIPDVVRAHDLAHGKPYPPLTRSLECAFAETAIFCAYCGEEPVGTGWIEFPSGGEFAGIHGGAVVPSFRGCRVYSALFDVRVQEAQRRGIPFLTVDAGPMSRPILLRKGFTLVCETTPYRMPR